MAEDTFAWIMRMIILAGFTIQFARYMTVVTYTLQFYDWLICFSDEYQYIHKARWTSVKVAFLVCRYYPLFVYPMYVWALVGNHASSVCEEVWRPLYVLVHLMPMMSQMVFIIRTYAFTGSNKFVGVLLVSIWMVFFGIGLWILMAKYDVFLQTHKIFGNYACIVDDPALSQTKPSEVKVYRLDKMGVYSLGILLFDSVMTSMVIIHCVRFRTTWGPLGKAFIRQGLIAFVTLSSLDLLAAVVLLMPDHQKNGLAVLRTPTSCVIACRLILMFRRRADPNATSQVQDVSKMAKEALEEMERELDDSQSDHNRPIEHWD